MTVAEQVKILNSKIKANKAQYDLDKEAAKMSALSTGELKKFEYLTGEDSGYKPDIIQKAKFEYSPLDKVFNEGLGESDKKEGLLKRVGNIEGKNEQQLVAIKDQGERQLQAIRSKGKKQLDAISSYGARNKSQKIEFEFKKYQKAKELVDEVNKMSRENEYQKFVCFHSNGTLNDFNKFRDIKQFENDMFNGHISIKQAKDEHDEMKEETTKLEN